MLDRFVRIEVEPEYEAIYRHRRLLWQSSHLKIKGIVATFRLSENPLDPISRTESEAGVKAGRDMIDRLSEPIPVKRNLVLFNNKRIPLPAKNLS